MTHFKRSIIKSAIKIVTDYNMGIHGKQPICFLKSRPRALGTYERKEI